MRCCEREHRKRWSITPRHWLKKSGAIRIPYISIAIDMAGPYLPAHNERKKCGSRIMP